MAAPWKRMFVWQVSDLQLNRLVYIKKRQEKKPCTKRLLSSKNQLNGNENGDYKVVSTQTHHNLQTQCTDEANENVICFIGYVFGHKVKVCKVLDKLTFLTDDGWICTSFWSKGYKQFVLVKSTEHNVCTCTSHFEHRTALWNWHFQLNKGLSSTSVCWWLLDSGNNHCSSSWVCLSV